MPHLNLLVLALVTLLGFHLSIVWHRPRSSVSSQDGCTTSYNLLFLHFFWVKYIYFWGPICQLGLRGLVKRCICLDIFYCEWASRIFNTRFFSCLSLPCCFNNSHSKFISWPFLTYWCNNGVMCSLEFPFLVAPNMLIIGLVYAFLSECASLVEYNIPWILMFLICVALIVFLFCVAHPGCVCDLWLLVDAATIPWPFDLLMVLLCSRGDLALE